MEKDIKDLVDRVLTEQDATIREQYCETLIGFGGVALPLVLPCLENDDWTLRYRIVKIINKIGVKDKDTFLLLEKALKNETDEDVQEMILKALLNAKVSIVTELSGEVKDHKLLKIWKFNADEANKIKELLEKNKIIFRELVTCCGHPDYEGYEEEVVFEVIEENIEQAIRLIAVEHFGLSGDSSYTGECPACTTVVEKVLQCPECELNLEMNPGEALVYHPFGKCLATLMENDIIKEKLL